MPTIAMIRGEADSMRARDMSKGHGAIHEAARSEYRCHSDAALTPCSVYSLSPGYGAARGCRSPSASRNIGDSAAPDTIHRATGTRNVEDYGEDHELIYLAPETTLADAAQGASLDVFSLGCTAFYRMHELMPP